MDSARRENTVQIVNQRIAVRRLTSEGDIPIGPEQKEALASCAVQTVQRAIRIEPHCVVVGKDRGACAARHDHPGHHARSASRANV